MNATTGVAATLRGDFSDENFNAHALLSELESHTQETGIQWEGKKTEEELKKAEEMISPSQNIRKLNVITTAASVLGDMSLEECKTLWTDLSDDYPHLQRKPEKMPKMVKAAEKMFDLIMKIDFDNMQINGDQLLENGDIKKLQAWLGMEMDYTYNDYEKIAESGQVQDMKYNEEMRIEVKARIDALMSMEPQIATRLFVKENPIANTPEGQEILKMDSGQLVSWGPTHKTASTELKAFADTLVTYKVNQTIYPDYDTKTAKQWLDESRETAKKQVEEKKKRNEKKKRGNG